MISKKMYCVTLTGCWLWLGFTDKDGYGRYGGRGAYVVSYEDHVGPIPEGMELDHLCRQRLCIRPEHLEPVTRHENVIRAKAAMTHCKNGHEFNELNTKYSLTKLGAPKRRCRICNRASDKRRRA